MMNLRQDMPVCVFALEKAWTSPQRLFWLITRYSLEGFIDENDLRPWLIKRFSLGDYDKIVKIGDAGVE